MSLDKDKLKEEISKKPNLFLEELLKKISESYGVKIDSLKKLVETESKKGLEGLKLQINSIENSKERDILNNLSKKESEELFFALKGAREIISKTSEESIKKLKEKLEKNGLFPEQYFYLSDKFLPQNLIIYAKNPRNTYEHILGACLGTINSAEKVVKITMDLLIGIGKGVYDLYLIASGKGKYSNFKKI